MTVRVAEQAAWDACRLRLRERAETLVREAARTLELLPEDPEARRTAGRLFREAGRLRSDQHAAAVGPLGVES